MSDESEEEKVGYKRPPKHTRFRKGRSGNPNGRPKGGHNFKTDVLATLNAPVPVTEDGRKRTVTTQKATLLRLREKALKGDPKALDRLLALAQIHNGEDFAEDAATPIADADQAIIDAFLARNLQARQETGKATPEGVTRPLRGEADDKADSSDE